MMWCRMSKWKESLFGILSTMALSGCAVGFVATHSKDQEQSKFSRPHRMLFGLSNINQRKTLCEGIRDRSEIETYKPMKLPERGQCDGHAIFGLLLGQDMIERYDIYQRPDGSNDDNVIVAYVKLGNRVDGHPGVVHGGILSLIFDDALGFAYEALGVKMAVTANLSVDFRAPVIAGTTVRVVGQLERKEGRKLFWKAQMTSMDTKILYAEATSLYIVPRSSA